jgi:hypothetical protein
MFRFTIRDVIWLTVVVTLVVCWFLASRRAARLQTENLAMARKAREVELLHQDAVKRLLESTTNLLHAKAERDLAERFRAEALEAKAASSQPTLAPSQ